MLDDLIPGELTIGGHTRTFTLRLPKRRDGDIPLVLALHGNHPDAGGWIMRDHTSFAAHADDWRIAVGYPDGQGGCWADGRGVTTADEAGIDDVEFLRAVIDWSAEHHGTAHDRTIVAGISNGAFMAHRLLASPEESDRNHPRCPVRPGVGEVRRRRGREQLTPRLRTVPCRCLADPRASPSVFCVQDRSPCATGCLAPTETRSPDCG